MLDTWNDTATRAAIEAYVSSVTADGPDFVLPEERIAVFDNDGTLWTEKPIPIQLDFALYRMAKMAEADESIRDQQPWKAAVEKDMKWLGEAMVKHYHGDDGDMKLLMGAVPRTIADLSIDDYDREVTTFFAAVFAPGPEEALSRLRVRPDGRANPLSGGERVHPVHRVGG